ncbi:MAG TPA: PIG-L family deacetylase [Bauldia sp.]|nr:PIG-L family deacetylase [Bauldia sp.]
MRIAVVIAHPDYVATIIGGTLAKHARAGDEVSVLVLCPGELGPGTIVYPNKSREELVRLRVDELDALAKTQRFKSLRVLREPDTEITNSPALRLAIGNWLRETRPDILLTHWIKDAHPDIREAGQAAIDACLISVLGYLKSDLPPHEVTKVYTFPIRTAIDFQPDTFVDISDATDAKFAGIACLDSVVRELQIFSAATGDPNRWKEHILAADLFWGRESGVRYAEAFRQWKQPEGRRALAALPL